MTDVGGGTSENGAQAQDWVYPLTEGEKGTSFGRDAGCSAGFADYCRAVTSTRISHGEGPLQAGFRSMRVGDVLWLHAGSEIGIVGRATVRKLVGNPQPWVTLALDRTASRVLAQDPMPSSVARRWLSGPMDRPIPLAEHSELPERLRWWIEDLGEDDRRRLEPLGVPPLRQALRACPSALKSSTFGAFTRMLRARDMAIGLREVPSGALVVACDDQRLVVAHVIAASKNAGRRVLESVGLLGWYGRSLAPDGSNGALTANNWLVFENPPPADLVAFLEEVGNFVCWSEDDRLKLGPGTKPRWEVLSRVPAVGARPRESPTRRSHTQREAQPRPNGQPPVVRGTWCTPVEDEELHGATALGDDEAQSTAAQTENTAQHARVEPQVPRSAQPSASESAPPPEVVRPPVLPSLKEYAPRVRGALVRARESASSHHHATVDTAHVMVALMDDPGEHLAKVLHVLDVTPARVRAVFEEQLARLPTHEAGPVALGRDLSTSFGRAWLEAAQTDASHVDACHLLLGILRADGIAARELGRCGVHFVRARAAVFSTSHPPAAAPRNDADQLGRRVARQVRRLSRRTKMDSAPI